MNKIVLAINTLRASLASGGMLQIDIDTLIDNLSIEIKNVVKPFTQNQPGPLKAAINNTTLLTDPQKVQFINDLV